MVLEREEQMRKYYLCENEKFYLSENEMYELRVHEDFENCPNDEEIMWRMGTREDILKLINMNPHLLKWHDLTVTYKPKPFTIPIEEFMEEEVA